MFNHMRQMYDYMQQKLCQKKLRNIDSNIKVSSKIVI